MLPRRTFLLSEFRIIKMHSEFLEPRWENSQRESRFYRMLDEYPKEIVLTNGARVVLRPLEHGDADPLVEFFRRIPDADRWYLRHDVTDPTVVRAWALNVDYERVIPIIALNDGQIIGDATLHRHRYGSSHHVGELRLVLDSSARTKRLGTW